MLAIKLKPIGKKGQRTFRVVVAEKRSKLRGRTVDDLGWYNPHSDGFKVENEKVKQWLKNGAKPTDTVYNLLVKAGVVEGKKRPVHSTKPSKKKKEKEPETKTEEPAKSEAPTEATAETSVETPKEELVKAEETKQEEPKQEESKE